MEPHIPPAAELTRGNVIGKVEIFKQNSQRLQLEGFKVESILRMMNNCADQCKLQYKESGLKDKAAEDV